MRLVTFKAREDYRLSYVSPPENACLLFKDLWLVIAENLGILPLVVSSTPKIRQL